MYISICATMNGVNDIMTSIYDTLLQLRYPHITNTELKDLATTVLSGDNRICLLSWLLTEKSPLIAAQLRKLKDAALEDQLFKYYSHIGISNNKDLLLGKRSLKEQLPTLRLLLDFVRKVHLEPFVSKNDTEQPLIDIVKLYVNDVNQIPLSIVKPKLNYTEAIKYFEESEKELLNANSPHVKTDLSENSCTEVDNKLTQEEQDVLFLKETEKFIEAFETISSWPVQSKNLDKDTANSISLNIKSICTDFSTLKKVLQAKDEICNMNLAQELPKTTTPLNAIIENIVIYNEELENQSMTNNSID